MIQSLLATHLDRARYEVHIAVDPGPPGAETAAFDAISRIPDITIVPTNFGPTVHSQSRGAVARSLRRGLGATLSLPQLAWYVRRRGIRIVHGTEKPRDSLIGSSIARLTGAKSVLHLHVKCHEYLNSRQRLALRQAHLILGVSQFVAGSVRAKGYPGSKVGHVVNGLDVSGWNPDSDGSRIRAEFSIEAHQPVAVIAARIFEWKGHRELIQAMTTVRAAIPAARLLIVGDDDPRAHGGKSFTAELRTLTKQLGLEDNVTFTGFRTDVAEFLAAADVYTMPTFEEPCAVAFLEAMAMKKPVVALRSGGTPEMVEHEKSGLLSEVGDVATLAGNLLRLFNDQQLRTAFGEYGRSRVLGYYNPQRMCADLDRIYSRLLGRAPATIQSSSPAASA